MSVRGLATFWALIALLASLLITAPIATAAPPPDPEAPTTETKIAPAVVQSLAEEETTGFWVRLGDAPDTSAAQEIGDWDERGTFVYDTLRENAEAEQRPIRDILDEQDVDYEAHWLVNAIFVGEGTADLATDLAGLPAVASIIAPTSYTEPDPITREAAAETAAAQIEWGVANINADDVWNEFGVTGEGITIANIDTGVDYLHPALTQHYRGYQADGTVDHDYNWLDVTGYCGDAPCDSEGHGTHTMGSMVGADGEDHIGVAPGATWIAANGCCPSDSALISSAEWMLAPTKLNGQDADPSKRPHIINNSWGSELPSNDPFMPEIQQAWMDAGIFAVWSNGNSGPDCETSGSPGSRTLSYSVGAHDVDNLIGEFSSRGPGQDGTIKPDISAPGVEVRSSFPGGGYAIGSGTSMAAPHVSGAVALLWAGSPDLIGDIQATRNLLDSTAIDTADDQCGGTPENNNVYGEGRLDALALLESAPRGGSLTGTVTDSSGNPMQSAAIRVTQDDRARTATTDATGGFALVLATGEWEVSATAFGYAPDTATVTVTGGEASSVELTLEPLSSHLLTGTITDSETGEPVYGADVQLPGTPLDPVVTDAAGSYSIQVPTGDYDVTVSTHCTAPQTTATTVEGDTTLDFALVGTVDGYGYSCDLEPSTYIEGDQPLGLSTADPTTTIDLPFPITYYGETYTDHAYVSVHGHVNFQEENAQAFPSRLPSTSGANAAVYPFWRSAKPAEGGGVFTTVTGEAPHRGLVVEYRNMIGAYDDAAPVDFEVTFWEDDTMTFAYRNLDAEDPVELGSTSSVGIENADGRVGLQYSFREEALSNTDQIRFSHPVSGFVEGTVTSAADGAPIEGATVVAKDAEGTALRTLTTGDDGAYRTELPVGEWQLATSAFGFVSADTTVRVTEGTTVTEAIVLEVAAAHTISGTVTADGEPVAGVTVSVDDTPLPAITTGTDGSYTIPDVPAQTYTLTADLPHCATPQSTEVIVEGSLTQDFDLARVRDAFGYTCDIEPAAYVEVDTLVELTGENATTSVDLPFPVTLYGVGYSRVHLGTNGEISFVGPRTWFNGQIPYELAPNGAVYPFWSSLEIREHGGVYTGVVGEAPNRGFVIEYRDVNLWYGEETLDFEATMWENGEITFAYRDLDEPPYGHEVGAGATVGLENADGTVAFQYSHNEESLSNDRQIRFSLPTNDSITGTVADANNGEGVADAWVVVTDEEGTVVRRSRTGADGSYRALLFPGSYTVTASRFNYGTSQEQVTTSGQDEVLNLDHELVTATLEADSSESDIVVAQQGTAVREVTITNTGTADLEWQMAEIEGGELSAPTEATAGPIAQNQPAERQLSSGEYADPQDSLARTTEGLTPSHRSLASAPAEQPADVVAEWPAVGVNQGYGIGTTEETVWVSDIDGRSRDNTEFLPDGTPTGTVLDADWSGAWHADMAPDGEGNMCQLNISEAIDANGIYCWDTDSGEVAYSLNGQPWAAISQRGLAYDVAEDIFYVGGWNEGVVYAVAGKSFETPGATLSHCSPADKNISGLGFDSLTRTLWVATNSETDTIYQVDPQTCAPISAIADPGATQLSGAGLEVGPDGDLWALDQAEGVVRRIATGSPSAGDVPWLSLAETSGTVAPGESATVEFTVDATDLTPGTYETSLLVSGNAGGTRHVQVPVTLVVSEYLQAINVGGQDYVDTLGDSWQADRAHTEGSWGHLGESTTKSTKRAIAGTEEDGMFQSRRDGAFTYQFDDAPAGTYQIDLGFATFQPNDKPGKQVFDVQINGTTVLEDHDVVASAGSLTADLESVSVEHTGGPLVIEFVGVHGPQPMLNSLRVTHLVLAE